jgi:hypothetical protein
MSPKLSESESSENYRGFTSINDAYFEQSFFFSPLHHPGFVFGSTDEDVYAVTVTCLLERVN